MGIITPCTPISTRVIQRKWSADSNASDTNLTVPGSFNTAQQLSGIDTLAEGNEFEQYEALDDHSKQTSVNSSGNSANSANSNGFHHTITIGMSPISQLNEDTGNEQSPETSGTGAGHVQKLSGLGTLGLMPLK